MIVPHLLYTKNMYYIYIIKSLKKPKLYIGFTGDLKKRMVSHNRGENAYTKHYKPWKLIYYESYYSKKDAQRRERNLKHFGKAYGQLKGRIKESLDIGI